MLRHPKSIARRFAIPIGLASVCAVALSGCCGGWGSSVAARNASADAAAGSLAQAGGTPSGAKRFDPYEFPPRSKQRATDAPISEASVAQATVADSNIALASATEEESSPASPLVQQGNYEPRQASNDPAERVAANAKRSLGYDDTALRGQSPSGGGLYNPNNARPGYGANVRPPPSYAPGSGDAYQREPMSPSGGYGNAQVAPQQSIYGNAPAPTPYNGGSEGNAAPGYPSAEYPSGQPRTAYQGPGAGPVGAPIDPTAPGGYPPVGPPPIGGGGYYETIPQNNVTPLDVFVSEARTGRVTFGVGVNSNAGVNGNITIDERNFDLFNPPRSWDDWVNGTAFRGAGQGFRIEAQPGSQVSRYLVSFNEPYLFGTDVNMNLSGFYFQRFYFDWAEQRLGGRAGLGYQLSPDLSAIAALRYEDVKMYSPRINTVPALNNVLGSNDLATAKFSLVHNTRDNAFFPTQGNYLELSYEQAFGQFTFPRGEIDARQHIRLYERPDGSGAHVLSFYGNVGVSGTDTPIFENYFIGGYGSLRGYRFRGVGPLEDSVRLGGRFKALGTAEYTVPITADDMVRLAFFVDAGTVQSDVKFADFRVAPGMGVLINVPALGPAPLALNFAFPIFSEPGDSKQIFSFQMGASR